MPGDVPSRLQRRLEDTRRDHDAEVLGEDESQEFVPLMAGIFRALNTMDSLYDEGY